MARKKQKREQNWIGRGDRRSRGRISEDEKNLRHDIPMASASCFVIWKKGASNLEKSFLMK